MEDKLYQLLRRVLSDELPDVWIEKNQTKELNKTKLLQLIDNQDQKLIGILFNHDRLKAKFFFQVNQAWVFKQKDFRFFVEQRQIANSYTQFKNKIGLTASNKFITEGSDVVLNFPFKDCVLRGNQDKEDAKRDEVFLNQILAQDEIDRLFEPKALVNWKRYDKDGEHEIDYEEITQKQQSFDQR